MSFLGVPFQYLKFAYNQQTNKVTLRSFINVSLPDRVILIPDEDNIEDLGNNHYRVHYIPSLIQGSDEERTKLFKADVKIIKDNWSSSPPPPVILDQVRGVVMVHFEHLKVTKYTVTAKVHSFEGSPGGEVTTTIDENGEIDL